MTSLLDLPKSMRMGPIAPKLHRQTWKATDWTPYPLQEEILLSRARQQVNAAGRRAGKSQTGGHKLIPEVFRAYHQQEELRSRGLRREFWIVGPEYSDAEKEFRVVWDGLQRMGWEMDHPGSYNNPEAGQMRIQMFGGRFVIHAKSAKYPQTLVGEGLSGVVFSEAAKVKPSVWMKYVRPTLADFSGWAYFGSTPEGKNWFYELWRLGQDPDRPDWASWRSPSWVNPYVYPGGVDEELLNKAISHRNAGRLHQLMPLLKMMNTAAGIGPKGIHPEIWTMFLDLSQELFNQEVACLFTEYVGRVFSNFDEEYHVTDDGYRPDWDTYACADYGFTNPFVWLIVQVDPHRERIHIVDEYYELGRTTREAGEEIQARGLAPRSIKGFFPDPAEPDRTRELSSLLRLRAMNPGALEIKDRIEWMRRGLKIRNGHLDLGDPERVPGLTIARRCVNTIREFNDYRYAETYSQAADRGRSAPENPLKKDDHTPEALGRFYSGFFGSPHRNAGARMSKTTVKR